jgi:NAD(P)-dependent dehydrogenase (short-subunit alcohol dehydrogenase family)
MPRGQDGDLLLGKQVLGVEPGEGVEGSLHERHVGAAVSQHPRLLSHSAQQHLDFGCVGFGGVGIKKLPQQLVIRAGLRRQRQAVRGGRGAAGAPGGRGGCLEDGAGLAEQHPACVGEDDAAAVAFEQGDTETPLELLNRPGQGRLSANKGLGYEIAAGLGARGYRVAVGARDKARGEAAVKTLHAAGVDAFAVPLDVTSDRSVTEAAHLVERQGGRLDALVNNAAISGEMGPGWMQDPTTLDLDVVRKIVETNVYGVIRVTNAMLPFVRRAASPRIVNISSSVGSVTLQADPDIEVGPIMAAYAPTKSYLNAVTVHYARQFTGTDILINAACPGLVATDFTGFRGRPPQEAAATAIRLATLPDGGPTGAFFNDDGAIPW